MRESTDKEQIVDGPPSAQLGQVTYLTGPLGLPVPLTQDKSFLGPKFENNFKLLDIEYIVIT